MSGYGVLAGVNRVREVAAYPGAKIIADVGSWTLFVCDMRSARTVPALLHMTNNLGGGLRYLVPWQLIYDEVVFVGDGQTAGNALGDSLAEAMGAHRSVDAYMWNHGASWIPSPAEFMILSGQISFRLSKGREDDKSLRYIQYPVVLPATPKGEETVSMYALKPVLNGLTNELGEPRNTRRARTRAVAALQINSG